MDALGLLRERAEKDEPNSLFSLVNDLSKVLCKKVSSAHLWSMVMYLLEGLVDSQGHSSSGACVVLNQIVKQRGTALCEQVKGYHVGMLFTYSNLTLTLTLSVDS